MRDNSKIKRFWDKRRDNDYRGPSFVMFKGYTLPSHEEMDDMDKHHLIYDIDPDIRSMVIELNKKGFKTGGSCAGHIPNRIHGFVTIMGSVPTISKIKLAKSILSKYGLKNISYKYIDTGGFWELKFKSVGLRRLRKQYEGK